jgi:signal peptidase
LIGLFYAFIRFPTTSFLTSGTPLDTLKFLGSNFLPTLAQSIFAAFLALFGGPLASIAYLGSLDAVQWLSPILPNPEWTIRALIDTLTPTIGLLTIVQTTSPFALTRSGIISKSEAKRNVRRTKKSFPLTWTAIALVGVLLVWGSTGLLGFKPSVVASGSMRPAFDVGDIAITVQKGPETIKPGDVIQYLRDGEFIVHRVVEVEKINGSVFFITKGDANNAPDDPVSQDAVSGKVLFIIPKLGWISIGLKMAAETIFNFLSKNLGVALAAMVLVIAALAFPVYRYENRPLRRLKRRR